MKLEPTSCKSDLERLELRIQQLEDKRHPDLWKFTYKGQEILFNSSYYTDYYDYTGYEIGNVTEVVLHTDTDIIIYTFQDFLDGLDKVVEYKSEQRKSFIIRKENDNNGKTYQKPIQGNLLCKQRLSKFQKSSRCYRSPGMFRYRNR